VLSNYKTKRPTANEQGEMLFVPQYFIACGESLLPVAYSLLPEILFIFAAIVRLTGR